MVDGNSAPMVGRHGMAGGRRLRRGWRTAAAVAGWRWLADLAPSAPHGWPVAAGWRHGVGRGMAGAASPLYRASAGGWLAHPVRCPL